MMPVEPEPAGVRSSGHPVHLPCADTMGNGTELR
jgi:hypothetical protein